MNIIIIKNYKFLIESSFMFSCKYRRRSVTIGVACSDSITSTRLLLYHMERWVQTVLDNHTVGYSAWFEIPHWLSLFRDIIM